MVAQPAKRVVLFASGSGSNVENIVRYFGDRDDVHIIMVLTNKKDAKVLERCKRLKVPALYFNAVAFNKSKGILEVLEGLRPDLIVLAGFLLKIPQSFIRCFPDRIVNIHPALLPKFGGKGMYGPYVHEAVKAQGEKETGITIHYVNEHYDKGAIIFQAKTPVSLQDSSTDIAEKVHALEYEHYPRIIDQLLLS